MKIESDKSMDTMKWFQNSIHFDLGELMQKSRYLACQSYAYSDAFGILYKEFIRYRTLRKKKFAQLRHFYKENGSASVADAERKAEVNEEYIKLYDKEKEFEGRYKHADNLIRSIRSILDAMRQEIAELRAEKKLYVEEELMEKVIKKINAQNKELERQGAYQG